MPVDVEAAEHFVYANARLLERHRLAVLLHGAPAEPVLQALGAYRNSDGGFGHALEPDVRGPHSEPTSTLAAFDVLSEVGALGAATAVVKDAADWVSRVADDKGAVPSALPAAAEYPHAPWMAPSQSGLMLTFAFAAALWEAGLDHPWREQATAWCWARLDHPDEDSAYTVKFALAFLDRVPDAGAATRAIERLGTALAADGSIPVSGGAADERLTPLTLSPQPGLRSRALFAGEQIEADLDRLERGQRDDGGWSFDWLGWSPGQTVEWRGIVTIRALATLRAHGRLTPRSP